MFGCFTEKEATNGDVGRDYDQFIKMIDTARLKPDTTAMIPGRIKAGDTSWQAEVQKAVFKTQTIFACGLDGKHGKNCFNGF